MNFHVANIELDTTIQCRATINMETVNDYAERMAEGDTFPPVELYGTKERAWIGDGWHRVMAARNVEFKDIPANLHAGGRADALKAALGANVSNGLRRTNADKRRCVDIALREFANLSDSAIASLCGVDHKTVAAYRPQQNLGTSQVEPRTGLDGKTRRVPVRPEPPADDDDDSYENGDDDAPIPPAPVATRKAGPPRDGMQFARIAIMNLEEIRDNDVERAQAFATVREWLDDHE